MNKLNRITGKVFGATASPTGDADNGPYIGQFGSAKLGTYNGTSDIATIQSLSAWSNGWIDAVTPTNQYPPLPERTGVDKVLSYQECYLLQSGVAEWDSATTYYINNFCRVGEKLYISLIDENLNNDPLDNEVSAWKEFAPGEKYLVDAGINGSTWWRLYNDTWKEQGGIATSQATELPWTQPVIESNVSSNSGMATSIGTMGGTEFAVSCSHIGNANRPLSSAFNGIIPESANMREAYSVAYVEGNGSLGGNWIKVYSPTPILLSELDVYWASLSTAARTTTLIVKATNNGSDPVANWDLLSQGTTSTSTSGGGNIPVKHIVDLSSNQNYYQYFYIQNTTPFVPSQAPYNVWYVVEVKLIATYTTSASNNIEFPLEFSNTNYTPLLSFTGASGANTYIDENSLATTGFTLVNAPTGRVNWEAKGY